MAQGHPSPPQALPTAFEAEKRSDGRSVTGSCLGTPPSINRAVPYLFARDPSTKVVVSVSRDGSHYRAIGKGATLEMKLLLAMLHKPLTGNLGAATRLATDLQPSTEEGCHIPGLI